MSGFLLDTNVISELVKPKPEAKVVEWVQATNEELLYLSVLTLGEIRKGIALLQDPTRRVKLEAWLVGELVVRFANRILSIDEKHCRALGSSDGTSQGHSQSRFACDRRAAGGDCPAA